MGLADLRTRNRTGAQNQMKKSPLKRMGKDKARETAKYWPLRRKFLDEHEFCEVPLEVHDCTLRATTVHHSKRQHWKIMNETKFWIPACLNGHTWIEDHKNQARAIGLILYK
jgi:hypothetical protein